MPDVVLDTNVLADVIAQYFDTTQRGLQQFQESRTINKDTALIINGIIRRHYEGFLSEFRGDEYPGYVVASTLAFVEIARKWKAIVDQRFSVDQFLAFIEQPPEWFLIEPVDENLIMILTYIPTHIKIARGDTDNEIRAIEWTDAIHIATAKARGENTLLAATDREIEPVII